MTIQKTIATSQESVNKCSLDSKIERAYLKGANAMFEFLQDEHLLDVMTTASLKMLWKKFKDKNG